MTKTRPRPPGVIWWIAGGAGVLVCLFVVLGGDAPARPVAPVTAEDAIAIDEWPMSESARRGQVVFERYCVGCHGETGLGDGPASEFLDPLPRNFQHGAFKFRSTPSGKLPLASDLLRTITCGLPGSSMPSFRLVAEPERRDVVQYVLHLASFRRGERKIARLKRKGMSMDQIRERLDEIKREVWDEDVLGVQAVAIPEQPKKSDAVLVGLGKQLYEQFCYQCHGKTGEGDGKSSFSLRDWKDGPIRPRDFTTGVFRSGNTAVDLFRRMRTGLNGTPMPSSSNSDDEVWAMVHYILSLKKPGARGPWLPAGCGSEGGANR